MSFQDLFLHFVHLTFVKKFFFMFYIFVAWLIKMYLNFDVFYNTYKTKTIIDNVLIFPTIQFKLYVCLTQQKKPEVSISSQ